jgi:hypothetical protein
MGDRWCGKWGPCANLDKPNLHIAELHAALRKVRISGDSLDWVFTRSNRRSCWLTFAALRIDGFSAIHSCVTAVRFQRSSARASFRRSKRFIPFSAANHFGRFPGGKAQPPATLTLFPLYFSFSAFQFFSYYPPKKLSPFQRHQLRRFFVYAWPLPCFLLL